MTTENITKAFCTRCGALEVVGGKVLHPELDKALAKIFDGFKVFYSIPSIVVQDKQTAASIEEHNSWNHHGT